MALRDASDGWGLVTQAVHWVTAFLLVWIFYLGFTMTDLPLTPAKFEVYALHKSLGLTVLTLTAARLLWRRFNEGPGLDPGMKRYEVILAKATHHLIYALLIAVPLSGWAYGSAAAAPTVWWGTITVPSIMPADQGLANILRDVHFYVAVAFLVVLAMHVAGALKHHFVAKDATLKRMVPGWR